MENDQSHISSDRSPCRKNVSYYLYCMHIKRTVATEPDFVHLVRLLDAELAERDGDEHDFYAQYNKLDNIKHAVIAYDDLSAVSCGAIKEYSSRSVEVKRMYTLPEYRGKGIAMLVLRELENMARELGYESCILETGLRQPEAIRLYEKCGYRLIPNYGQYEGMANSVCFEKLL